MNNKRTSIVSINRVGFDIDNSHQTSLSYFSYNGFLSYGFYDETNRHIYEEYRKDFNRVASILERLKRFKCVDIVYRFDTSMEAKMIVYRFKSDKCYQRFHRLLTAGSIGHGCYDKSYFNKWYEMSLLDFVTEQNGHEWKKAFFSFVAGWERQEQFQQKLLIMNENQHHISDENKRGLCETIIDLDQGGSYCKEAIKSFNN